jgi:hypothetical protein
MAQLLRGHSANRVYFSLTLSAGILEERQGTCSLRISGHFRSLLSTIRTTLSGQSLEMPSPVRYWWTNFSNPDSSLQLGEHAWLRTGSALRDGRLVTGQQQ